MLLFIQINNNIYIKYYVDVIVYDSNVPSCTGPDVPPYTGIATGVATGPDVPPYTGPDISVTRVAAGPDVMSDPKLSTPVSDFLTSGLSTSVDDF